MQFSTEQIQINPGIKHGETIRAFYYRRLTYNSSHMLFGIVLVAVSLMRTQFGLVARPMTGVTFNWSAVTTIVF